MRTKEGRRWSRKNAVSVLCSVSRALGCLVVGEGSGLGYTGSLLLWTDEHE